MQFLGISKLYVCVIALPQGCGSEIELERKCVRVFAPARPPGFENLCWRDKNSSLSSKIRRKVLIMLIFLHIHLFVSFIAQFGLAINRDAAICWFATTQYRSVCLYQNNSENRAPWFQTLVSLPWLAQLLPIASVYSKKCRRIERRQTVIVFQKTFVRILCRSTHQASNVLVTRKA